MYIVLIRRIRILSHIIGKYLNLIKDLCVVTLYTCLKIYLYKKALFIFVNNATFYSMLYHGVVEYVANTWICVYKDSKIQRFKV